MRQQIITTIETALATLDTTDTPGACLYFAHIVALTLHRYGLRPAIQAGSLQWPRMPRADDDGRIDTHFAYTWQPNHPASRAALARGTLPEIHVWCGLPDTQELIDFSTRHLRDAARAAGLEWTAPDPPRYLWATADEMPDWTLYTPDRGATLFACRLLARLFRPAYLVPRRPRCA